MDNNPAESVNAMLRRDADGKEHLIDEMALLLWKHQTKKHNELIKALDDIGEFTIKDCIKERYEILLRPFEIQQLPSTFNELMESIIIKNPEIKMENQIVLYTYSFLCYKT